MRTPDAPGILIHVMVLMAAADGKLSEVELQSIVDITKTLPAFESIDREALVSHAKACTAVLDDADGVDQVIALARDGLPSPLHETAYAVAVEVAAADLKASQEELRLLQMLRDGLELDPLVSAAIERSARARFRRV